jgi:hypothetical protein
MEQGAIPRFVRNASMHQNGCEQFIPSDYLGLCFLDIQIVRKSLQFIWSYVSSNCCEYAKDRRFRSESYVHILILKYKMDAIKIEELKFFGL